jgi:biotin transporter BioY
MKLTIGIITGSILVYLSGVFDLNLDILTQFEKVVISLLLFIKIQVYVIYWVLLTKEDIRSIKEEKEK